MILTVTQFELDGFKIPSFHIKKGEIISICLYSGMHFFELEQQLADIFTGKVQHPNVEVFQQGQFIAPFITYNRFKGLFFPYTVQRYLTAHANIKSHWIEKLFQIDYITPHTKINRLAGNYHKWLSLFAAFSQSDFVIFDLTGQDPLGAQQSLVYIQEFVSQGGTALLLDNVDEFQTCYHRYYKITKSSNA